MPDIVTCGIPRSGSTLVWQLVQQVVSPDPVLKAHPDSWEPDPSSVVFITVRNPLDVIASALRVKLSREGRKEGKVNQEDVDKVLQHSLLCWDKLLGLQKHPHKIVLRYEQFYSDYNVIWDAIWSLLGIRPAGISRQVFNEQYSLQSNMKRASKLKDFSEMDEAHIHGDHIGSIMPSRWRFNVPLEFHSQLMDRTHGVRGEWGYAYSD